MTGNVLSLLKMPSFKTGLELAGTCDLHQEAHHSWQAMHKLVQDNGMTNSGWQNDQFSSTLKDIIKPSDNLYFPKFHLNFWVLLKTYFFLKKNLPLWEHTHKVRAGSEESRSRVSVSMALALTTASEDRSSKE